MHGKGITYDTGFIHQGVSTRDAFNAAVVAREMRLIRTDLHCTAVRLTGGDPDRLASAASHAAAVGLEIWLCPFTCDLSTAELLALLADAADHAERLRRQGATVVCVTGSELSLFTQGFLPGETLIDRLSLLAAPDRLRAHLQAVPAAINAFLARAVAVVRARFGGRISYASLPFEGVDWTPFDVIASDAGCRSREIADHFRADIRAFVAQGRRLGKPVAITEFGCTTHRGAGEKGGRGDQIIAWSDDGRPVRLNGAYVRDEEEQATYLRELLDIFSAEGIDDAFVHTFARYDLPHRTEPRVDLDRASYGIVKVLEGRHGATYPDLPWEPKAAFRALAASYGG